MRMRKPTSYDEAFAWHRDALLGVYGDGLPTNDEPQCGWFKRRLVKGGPFVPARIWLYAETDPVTGELMADETLQCEVNGQHADAHEAWLWLCANPITEAEFKYLTAVANYAAWHAPNDPAANPARPVDWLSAPIPTFNRRKTA